ncbi:putative bifunctional diguanylate cyclase/phosphodiesterase, partial [Novosphingobium sp.]|uniref:putative bifunctional diguanylate cyclase/phosphodiesterase n=1 Tax=Novosphingobium sp. TaxID=1874826 RepID=UPI0035B0E24A
MRMPFRNVGSPQGSDDPRLGSAKRDVVALAIAATAIIMFVGTGGTVLSGIVRGLAGHGGGPDRVLTNALLLNIALIIFGWRRYRELAAEVSERRRAQSEAMELAERDPLTGCLNRRSIAPQTDALIASATPAGKAVAFIMLDLDSFKQVNDVHGHHAGDALLRETALRIRSILPPAALLGRIGGDEFACVIPFDANKPETIDQFARHLIEDVARPLRHGSGELETSISVGLVRNDGHDEPQDAQSLLHMADIAMYYAKAHGRNCYYWFEPAMETELRFRSELESGIRRGIPLGEFVPYYEKQVDLATGEVVGFEMLARWNSPKLGVVSPEIFIPVAEEMGLIAELSESVISQALADARAWDPKLTLSVNISPIQMRDPWFAQKILKLLVEA